MAAYTLCPSCRGKRDACSYCEGTGRVSPEIAAAYFIVHPEARRADTAETPVELDDDSDS